MNTKSSPTRQEHVVIVDEKNNVIGSASRSDMRRLNLIHRATYILIFNSRSELFVQQRTPTKDIYPGYYEIACGGVVQEGEDYDLSARRELAEEAGISQAPLSHVVDFFWQDEGNRVWGRVYTCVWDGPLVLQEEEVVWGTFVPFADALSFGGTHPLTPDSIYLLERYADEIQNSV